MCLCLICFVLRCLVVLDLLGLACCDLIFFELGLTVGVLLLLRGCDFVVCILNCLLDLF